MFSELFAEMKTIFDDFVNEMKFHEHKMDFASLRDLSINLAAEVIDTADKMEQNVKESLRNFTKFTSSLNSTISKITTFQPPTTSANTQEDVASLQIFIARLSKKSEERKNSLKLLYEILTSKEKETEQLKQREDEVRQMVKYKIYGFYKLVKETNLVWEKRIAELENQLHVAYEKIKKIDVGGLSVSSSRQKEKIMNGQLQELEKEMKRKEVRNSDLERELKFLKGKPAEIDRDLLKRQEKNLDYEKELKKKDEKLSELNIEMAKKDDLLEDRMKEFRSLESRLNEIQSDLKRKSDKIKSLEQEHKNKDDQISELIKNVKNLETKKPIDIENDNRLGAELKIKEKQIEQLTKELKEKDLKNNDLANKHKVLESNNISQIQELKEIKLKCEDLKQAENRDKERFSELNGKINKNQERMKELDSELIKRNDRIFQSEKDTRTLNQKLQTVSGQYDTLKERNVELENKIKVFSNENEEIKSLLKTKETEIGNLIVNVRNGQEKIIEQEKEYQRNEIKFEEARKKIVEFEKELKKKETRIIELEKDLSKKDKRIIEIEEDLIQMSNGEKEFKKKDEKLSIMAKEIDLKNQSLENLVKELAEKDSEISRTNGSLNEKSNCLKQTEGKLSEAEKKIQNLQKSANISNEKFDNLTKEFDSKIRLINELQNEIKLKSDMLETLQYKLDSMDTSVKAQVKQIQEDDQTLERTMEDLASSKAHIQNLEADLKSKVSENKIIKKQYEDEIISLNQKLSSYNDTNEVMKNEMMLHVKDKELKMKEISKLQVVVEDKERVCQRMGIELEQNKERIQRLEQEKEQLYESNQDENEYLDRIRQLQFEVDELSQKLNTREIFINELESKIKDLKYRLHQTSTGSLINKDNNIPTDDIDVYKKNNMKLIKNINQLFIDNGKYNINVQSTDDIISIIKNNISSLVMSNEGEKASDGEDEYDHRLKASEIMNEYASWNEEEKIKRVNELCHENQQLHKDNKSLKTQLSHLKEVYLNKNAGVNNNTFNSDTNNLEVGVDLGRVLVVLNDFFSKLDMDPASSLDDRVLQEKLDVCINAFQGLEKMINDIENGEDMEEDMEDIENRPPELDELIELAKGDSKKRLEMSVTAYHDLKEHAEVLYSIIHRLKNKSNYFKALNDDLTSNIEQYEIKIGGLTTQIDMMDKDRINRDNHYRDHVRETVYKLFECVCSNKDKNSIQQLFTLLTSFLEFSEDQKQELYTMISTGKMKEKLKKNLTKK